ncbi:MAG TPA: (2Fe-2S) ferredoxin domain-containing protein [Leptolyngbyaceae cyanobacterium M33_DOE_097]|uniref:(2Fe-2S) ferredoxin domain-containing protein n=1 Tax=Oscillatoriales cyanobacterium SpSt-418 TaxID=2282169 RepID=A0A7C3KCL3_9CYAN|nr:(2Fe-2S) ferredoxin domain-containing protein [Leptolyngbyaceae cyanobacterium M33_DOE_097]
MPCDRQVLVCQYTNCVANDSQAVLAAFQANPVAGVEIAASGCQGQCNMGTTVRILPDETWYARVKPEDVPEIVEQHLKLNQPVDRLLHPRFHPRFSF